MTRPLTAAGIAWAVVPGVSSAHGRDGGRRRNADPAGSDADGDPHPRCRPHADAAGEDLESLAAHRTTLCIYLSITLLHKVQQALRAAGWAEDAPILVVQKASWPGEEKIVRGTLADIKQKCQAEKIASQAMIVASPTLGAADWPDLIRSKLYDPSFTHRFRKPRRPAHD
jgi:precorrin-4/cobalt-precorrin-4 C11-methyltransferase